MMSANITVAPGTVPIAPRRAAFAGLAAFRHRLGARLALRRDLRRLAMTDPRLLRDAGIDPDWAAEEIDKPLWRG